MCNMNIISETNNLDEYLTKRPDVTFNKEVYKRYTDITNSVSTYKFGTTDGFTYSYNDFCNNKNADSYITEIYLYILNDNNVLIIDDIISVDISLVSENTISTYHKYSGKFLKAIKLATENINLNRCAIELPLTRYIFINEFLKSNYKLQINVTLNKHNVNLWANVTYVKMLDQLEISNLDKLQPHRLTRHLIDEVFQIEKGLNVIKLSPENMQCCLIFFIFPENMSNVNATLKIGEYEHKINKYCSNIQFCGLCDNPNIMIFDIYKNVSEFYNIQPTGNVKLDGNASLTFESAELGHLMVGYVLLDLIMYMNNKIKFFDMPLEFINKKPSIKYVTIKK